MSSIHALPVGSQDSGVSATKQPEYSRQAPSPARQTLRDYQIAAIDALRDRIRAGHRSILLVAPTGSGKTSIAAAMIESATQRGKRCQFLAHRKELIDQCSSRLDSLGVDHGIIKADHWRRRPWLSVHVCSVPTLARREQLPPADLIFIDECHRAASRSYRDIIAKYPNAVFIGLTATPVRTDGRGLADLFTSMVECPSVAELTEMGYLVPTRVFAPSTPDLSGVHTQAGDYRVDELAIAVDKPKLTGDIVAHWKRLAADRITIVFAVNREHGKHIHQQFHASSVTACEYLDGETPEPERVATLARFSSGQTRIVVNVGLFTEGYDNPAIACAVLARPTQSLGLYLQMAGRILRPYPGKHDALILDHAGVTTQHGFVDDPREWSLTADRKRRTAPERSLAVRMCLQCWCAFRATQDACPACGWKYEGRRTEVEEQPGELEEVARRYVCDRCKREMPGAGKFSPCECGGQAKRAYTLPAVPHRDPEIRKLQETAAAKGYAPGWFWYEKQRLLARRVAGRMASV